MNVDVVDVVDNLLQIKIERELLNDLVKEYQRNNKLSTIYSKNEFIEICKRKIKIKNKKNLICIQDKIQGRGASDNKRCCARIWFHHRGARCPYSKYKGDYCKKHSTMIQNLGYLRFRRHDEKRPMYNEKGNKIPWYDYSPMETINIVIQYQNMNLLKLIK